MLGRGTRIDKKTGKFSFKVLDFTGLCQIMDDNGKGTEKENQQIVGDEQKKGNTSDTQKGITNAALIFNEDPANMIQRTIIKGDEIEIIDNITIDKAREIFEQNIQHTDNTDIQKIKDKLISMNIEWLVYTFD
jgi:type I site-specific restriction endonuclease